MSVPLLVVEVLGETIDPSSTQKSLQSPCHGLQSIVHCIRRAK